MAFYQSTYLWVWLHVSDTKQSWNVVFVDFRNVFDSEGSSGNEFPHGFGQVEAQGRSRSHRNAHQNAKELELVGVNLRDEDKNFRKTNYKLNKNRQLLDKRCAKLVLF